MRITERDSIRKKIKRVSGTGTRQAQQLANLELITRDKNPYAFFECWCGTCKGRFTIGQPASVKEWLSQHINHATTITPKRGFKGPSA